MSFEMYNIRLMSLVVLYNIRLVSLVVLCNIRLIKGLYFECLGFRVVDIYFLFFIIWVFCG